MLLIVRAQCVIDRAHVGDVLMEAKVHDELRATLDPPVGVIQAESPTPRRLDVSRDDVCETRRCDNPSCSLLHCG